MKKNQILLIISLIIINLTVSSTWAKVTNGSLEFRTDIDSYVTLNPGCNSINNRPVAGHTDIDTYCLASDVIQSIDISKFYNSIQDEMTIISGTGCNFSYDMAENSNELANIKTLYTVSDVRNLQTLTFDSTGMISSDIDCAKNELLFVANANIILLKHTSFVDSGWGAVVDNSNCLFNLNPGIIILGSISVGFAVWAKRRITV